MKRLCIALLLLLAASPVLAWSGKVVGVTDGDTLTVLRVQGEKREEVKVRLYGIDAPEKSQPFYAQSKATASALVFGKVVDVQAKGKDRYGRTLAEVISEDKWSLNRALVWYGMAWWYKKYAPKNKDLEKLESEARKAKRGLWTDAAPVPPWQWREEHKKKTSAAATESLS